MLSQSLTHSPERLYAHFDDLRQGIKPVVKKKNPECSLWEIGSVFQGDSLEEEAGNILVSSCMGPLFLAGCLSECWRNGSPAKTTF